MRLPRRAFQLVLSPKNAETFSDAARQTGYRRMFHQSTSLLVCANFVRGDGGRWESVDDIKGVLKIATERKGILKPTGTLLM